MSLNRITHDKVFMYHATNTAVDMMMSKLRSYDIHLHKKKILSDLHYIKVFRSFIKIYKYILLYIGHKYVGRAVIRRTTLK